MKNFSSIWVMRDVIGKILDELLNKAGAPTKDDFAGMLGISVKTLYNVTKGKSTLGFDQVVKASEILNYNMVEEFLSRTGKKEKIDLLSSQTDSRPEPSNIITTTLTIVGSLTTYGNFPKLINKIRNDARDLGFDIS